MYYIQTKEVCNGVVACSLLKLGRLEKTVIASLFHSDFTRASFFYGKNDVNIILGNKRLCRFLTKKTKKFYEAKLIF